MVEFCDDEMLLAFELFREAVVALFELVCASHFRVFSWNWFDQTGQEDIHHGYSMLSQWGSVLMLGISPQIQNRSVV